VLGAVAFANLVVAALHFGLAAAGPLVRSEFGLNEAALGLVLAAPALGLMLGTFGWGVLADRTSERRVLTAAFVGFSGSMYLAAAAARDDSAIGFAAALLASGAFGSAAHSAGGRAISAAFPVERHGLVLSIRHVAIPIGAAIGGVLVPIMAHAHGLAWVATGALYAGLAAAGGLALLVPSSRSVQARRERAHAPAAGTSPLRERRMWLLAGGAGSLAFVQLGIGSFLTVQLVDRADVSIAAAALVFMIAQLLGAAGRIVLGIWSDRVSDRVSVLIVTALLALVLVSAAAVVSDPLASTMLQAATLVIVTSCNGVVVAVAASLAPAGRTGATLGMQTTANAAACSVAPILLGVVLVQQGWGMFLGIVVLVLVGSLVALRRLHRLRAATASA
jgi:MFS family permease